MSTPEQRILYVITDLEIGGVPLHLLRLATAIQEQGYKIRVISLAPPGPVTKMLTEAGVETRSCYARSVYSLGACWRLHREIKSFKPTLVHSFLFHANLACRLVCSLAMIPPRKLICEIQTVEIERKWHLRLDRWTHWLCRLEIGNSPSVIEHLHRKAGLPKSKLQLVIGGVDVERFNNAQPISRSNIGVPEDCALLLWVGRFDRVKGLDILLEAFKLIKAQRSANLILVGEGPEYYQIEQRVNQWGLANSVHLLGVRKDVPQLLKTCDVFVFPSLTEGFPNALLEAMAAGRPIVCTNVPGNRDLIHHRVNGIQVAVKDHQALAQEVLKLIENRPLASFLAKNATESVRKHYDSKTLVQNYLHHYFT